MMVGGLPWALALVLFTVGLAPRRLYGVYLAKARMPRLCYVALSGLRGFVGGTVAGFYRCCFIPSPLRGLSAGISFFPG